MLRTTRIAAFAVAALLSFGASSVMAKGKDTGTALTVPDWDCAAQGFTTTQANTIRDSFASGMDAATIANLMNVPAANVQACITANGG